MAARAVVIGPGSYPLGSEIESHPTIEASARMYGEVLSADPLWDECLVLTEDEVATVGGVMRALQTVVEKTGPDDTLMVVYVGHGQYWSDVPGGQVHFAVGSSFQSSPWTWVSSWYVYRAMRQSRAKLKVLIADCCYSNLLPQLGDDPTLPGVLGEADEGTCVFTAVKNVNMASAEGCSALPKDLARCTPFSGHLLDVLRGGTQDHHEHLTVGLLREAVRSRMTHCTGARHAVPRMALNDAREGTPLFTNRSSPGSRYAPRLPQLPEEWMRLLLVDRSNLDALLRDERMAAEVVARFSREPDEASQRMARLVDGRANQEFSSPQTFARYFNQMERALRA